MGLSVGAAEATSRNAGASHASHGLQRWELPFSPGPLSADEFAAYWQEGYLVKSGLLSEALLRRAREAVEAEVDLVAEALLKAGKIHSGCRNEGFETRLACIERQYPSASVLLHKRGVLPEAFSELWGSCQLTAAVQQLLGPDIAGHPVWNLRSKAPQQAEMNVPWHQDNAYMSEEAWNNLTVVAWIPLVDANENNGCMQVLEQGHRSGQTAKHTCCQGGTWYVEMDEQDAAQRLHVDMQQDVITCPMPAGSVLLMNAHIPHRSLPNLSSGVRWSIDLRWQHPDLPNGFYGLKECIVLTKKGDPNFTPEWKSWAAVDRGQLQQRNMGNESKDAMSQYYGDNTDEDFDATVHGPWMDQWEIVNHNKHTAAHDLKPDIKGKA
ncbi:hypothetical protein WJX82_001016 [Trebouxia sp. C0006]